MSDWTSQQHAKDRKVEAARKQLAFDPDKKPWQKIPPRAKDPELAKNARDMSKVPNPSVFRKHDGSLKVQPKGSKSLGDSEPFLDDEIDPVGWPEKDGDVGGTFSFEDWLLLRDDDQCLPCA